MYPVSGSGALGPDLWKIFKIPLNEFLGILLVFFLLFFLYFFARRFIDGHPENQPGSGSRALGLTEDVWHQKYENKKEGLQNYLEYSFNSILNIFCRSRYRAQDPEFGQHRIHVTVLMYLPFFVIFCIALHNGDGIEIMKSHRTCYSSITL